MSTYSSNELLRGFGFRVGTGLPTSLFRYLVTDTCIMFC